MYQVLLCRIITTCNGMNDRKQKQHTKKHLIMRRKKPLVLLLSLFSLFLTTFLKRPDFHIKNILGSRFIQGEVFF